MFIGVRPVNDPATPVDESLTRTNVSIGGSFVVHPDYGLGHWLANDMAVLRLNQPASQRALVSPIPISGALPPVGSNVTMVGFGMTNGPRGECSVGLGTKRRATTPVDQHVVGGTGDKTLVVRDPLIHVCPGDSGGPALDTLGRVAGVASNGDNASNSAYKAVRAYQEWIGLQGNSPGNRVAAWDLSGAAPAASVYADVSPDPLGLLGWIEESDVRLVGDFMGLGHDQILYVNKGGAGGRLRIADHADGRSPTESLYWDSYGGDVLFNGWLGSEDVQLAGDFMGLGHDQLLLINRASSVGGGRLMIVSFAGGAPAIRYLERWGDDVSLNGWHDSADRFLVGDYFGDGHDHVLFLNRDGGGGRILIADFSDGAAPIAWRYYEAYADGVYLNGWHDGGDDMLAGDFRGMGRDQVLFINGGPGINGVLGDGRVLIVDFGDGAFPAEWQLYLSTLQATLLDPYLGPQSEDVALAGNFRGLSHDQVAFINRTPAGLDRVLVADFAGTSIGIAFVQNQLVPSGLPQRIHSSDLILAGDLVAAGRTQLVTLERLEQ
jgi:hypothetical protein